MSASLGVASGFARGLAGAFASKRQRDDALAAETRQRRASVAQGLVSNLLNDPRVQDPSDLAPYLQMAMGGDAGDKPKARAGASRKATNTLGVDLGDPVAVMSHFIGPAFAERQAESAAGTPGGAPASASLSTPAGPSTSDPASIVAAMAEPRVSTARVPLAPTVAGARTPLTTPSPTEDPDAVDPAGGSVSFPGMPPIRLFSREQLVEREGRLAGKAQEAKDLADTKRAQSLYRTFQATDLDFTLRDAMRAAGFNLDTQKTFAPKTIGRSVKIEDIPPGELDMNGRALDPNTPYWQATQQPDGKITWTPAAEPTTTFKPLTGDLGERTREVLALSNLDERTATPEQQVAARVEASQQLRGERQAAVTSTQAARDSIAANRAIQATLLQMQANLGGVTPGQQVQLIQGFRRDWTKATAPYKSRMEYIAKLDEGIAMLAPGARYNRNAATQTIINSFNRLLEEGNAVREGEYARSEDLTPYLSRITSFITKITEGGGKIGDADLIALANEGKAVARKVGEVHEGGLRDLRGAIESQLPKIKAEAREVFGGSTLGVATFSTTYQGKQYDFDTQAKLDAFKRQYRIP